MAVLIGKKNLSVKDHLAMEEYLLRHYDIKEDILYIWFGANAFVYGRNQNPFIEIHSQYLMDDSVEKFRRISGGGTIYEDSGTLNFSIITKNYKHRINDYQYFLNPLIRYLNQLGIKATFKPKTHIFVGEKKISGNAQAFVNNRLMHHGTLLFQSDLSIIEKALVNHSLNAKGHQVLSNKQKVVNIKSMTHISEDDFVKGLVNSYCQGLDISPDHLGQIDVNKINQLINDKYSTWAWNYGMTPNFEIDVMYKGADLSLSVEKGLIQACEPKVFDDIIKQKFDISKFIYKKV